MKKVILFADISDSSHNYKLNKIQEWEDKKSIEEISRVILNLGYNAEILESRKVGSLEKFLQNLKLKDNKNIILFNLVEGYASRNREAYIPALAEFLGIPFTGSDTYAQCISLDKYLSKLIAKEIGIETGSFYLLREIFFNFNFPIFIKPNHEGSSLGIEKKNLVLNEKEGQKVIPYLLKEYEEILVEEYLPGSDLTLGVIGHSKNYRATKLARLEYPDDFYSSEIKTKSSMPEKLYFDIEVSMEKKIQEESILLCERIGVEGYARLDWKISKSGEPCFLEINLTPGLSPFYSSLPICYEQSFGTYENLIQEILDLAEYRFKSSRQAQYGKTYFR